MKKFYLLGAFLGLSMMALAQDEYVEPTVLEDVYLQRISPDGTMAMGQDGLNSFLVGYNLKTGEQGWYPACYPGDGNCVANNGAIAGQEMRPTGMYAVIMKDDKIYSHTDLQVGGFSLFHAITPDGSRATGYLINTTERGPYFTPIVCDVNPNGSLNKPVKLPCPQLDFFGTRPTYIMGVCISDDGKTILGFVFANEETYSWPIIFREDENGKWSYTQPTEVLFNPNNEPLMDPPRNDYDRSDEPKIRDYMTPEQWEAYQQALADHGGNYDAYWNFMDNDKYDQYYDDHTEWASKVGDQYLEEHREYDAFVARVGREERFGGIAQIDPKGKWFITAKSGVPYKFNIEDDSFAPWGMSYTGSLTQILTDGTIVSCTMQGNVPYQTYVRLPDSNRSIKVTDYLAENRPGYLYWLEDSFLNVNGNIVTGVIAFSDDMETFFGGYHDGEGGAVSYVFDDKVKGSEQPDEPEISGMTDIDSDSNDSMEVYNLNGIRLNSVNTESDLRNLPKGIYIVNGKKIAI